ncbi:unnamed protein product [Acanthoscelides obtectus]|uniref:Uncharacterized protein n=1 Tax=Acanthoscelides obtectus TaxID=200917 RepID=A0A9P0KMZ6_ACAOB|nr:unnamed protein product [Acanthoscelides obtectus]CAK1669267.1 hypothetical protein AOBTE_LOCUS26912 [Acanthoscelides obtectus]
MKFIHEIYPGHFSFIVGDYQSSSKGRSNPHCITIYPSYPRRSFARSVQTTNHENSGKTLPLILFPESSMYV